MTAIRIKPLHLIAFLILGILVCISLIKGNTRNQELSLIKNEQIRENYNKFQEIAKEKGIAMMPNEKALEVPEIKAILKERDALLAKIAPNCRAKYKHGEGITSAQFNPLKVECDPWWWK